MKVYPEPVVEAFDNQVRRYYGPEEAMKETELAEKVCDYLMEFHWNVFQEVQPFQYGSIADIIAVQERDKHNLIWIIECKTSLSMSLLAQAYEWRKLAHFVSIAFPSLRTNRQSSKSRIFVRDTMKHFGMGMIEVSRHGVREELAPCLNRAALTDRITSSLSPEHMTFAKAGCSNGKRWTRFQETSKQVLEIVRLNPGISMKQIISRIKHHYSSEQTASSSLSMWIRDGIIKGIRTERVKGKNRYYLEKKGKKKRKEGSL